MSTEECSRVRSKSGVATFVVVDEDGLFTVYQLQDGHEAGGHHQTFTDREKAEALAVQLAKYT